MEIKGLGLNSIMGSTVESGNQDSAHGGNWKQSWPGENNTSTLPGTSPNMYKRLYRHCFLDFKGAGETPADIWFASAESSFPRPVAHLHLWYLFSF